MGINFIHPSLDLSLFLSTFAVIFLAELPDKTALAIILLASRRQPLGIFIGVAAAYVVQNAVAVIFGGLIALLPPHIVHIIAGLLFLVFAFLIWKENSNEKEVSVSADKRSFLGVVVASFMVIFIAEWGDLTQLATVTLVARTRQPITVFLASTLALWTTTALLIFVGYNVKKFLKPRILRIVAALAFTAVGILLLAGFWD